MAKRYFSESDLSTLANICIVAAERFNENADIFDKLGEVKTPKDGSLMPTGQAAKRLAEQFRSQATEAAGFGVLFQCAAPIMIEYDDEEHPK